MRRLLFIFPIGFLGITMGYLLAQSEVPNGFRFERGTVKITGNIAKMIKAEARSLNRDRFINAYNASLDSEDPTRRIWSAWALGNFQSELALNALLAHAQTESSEPVLLEIFTGLSVMFELSGMGHSEDGSVDLKKRHMAEWGEGYRKLGYRGLLTHGWETACAQGSEGINRFVVGITARCDPRLIPLLLQIRSTKINNDMKSQIDRTVLSWSGFDLKHQSIADVSDATKSDSSLDSENIKARYVAFFERLGYLGNADEIGSAILLFEQDQQYREMALRMLSCP